MSPEDIRKLRVLDALAQGFARTANLSAQLSAPWNTGVRTSAPRSNLDAAQKGQEFLRQQRQQSAQASLMGGYDPRTGITWDQGRQLPTGNVRRPSGTDPLPPSLMGDAGRASLMAPALKQRQADLAQGFPTQYGAALTKSLFGDQKPPTVREFKVGDNIVTRQWDPTQRKFVDLHTAPRFEGDSGTLTTAQERSNAEIDQARKTLEGKGIGKADILKMTQKMTDTGLDNTSYDPSIAGLVRTATKRKFGDDPDHGLIYNRYLGTGRDPITEPPDIPAPVGMDLLSGLGTGATPALTATRPRGRGQVSQPATGGIDKGAIGGMSRDEIEALVLQHGDSLPPDVLQAIYDRLERLGL